MDTNSSNPSYQKKISKPWGEEIIYTPKDFKYTFKMLKISKNKRLSLQSHSQKTETLVLIEGQVDLVIGPSLDNLETVSMKINQSYNIPSGTVHRLEALEDSIIMEASTPEIGTTFRYQDDYHRSDETYT